MTLPPLQFRASTSRTLPKKQSGFVLVATLALLGLAVVSVIVVTSLIRSQTDLIEAKTHQAISRQNALNSLNIAIGQLQYSAGNDRVITAPAATLLANDENGENSHLANPHWSEVINTASGATTWLVSSPTGSPPNPINAIEQENRIELVGQYTAAPDDSTHWVTGEKVPLQTRPNRFATNAQPTGHFAYWTGELNTRANVALTDQISPEINDPYSLASNRLMLPRRSATESVFPAIDDPDDSTTQEKLSRVITPEQLFFLTEDREPLQLQYHHFTTFSRSVLCNPLEGGLKINLTDPTYTDSIVTPTIRQQITPAYHTTREPEQFQIAGSEPKQVFSTTSPPVLNELLNPQNPVITEFALTMGIFHTQSDRRHRIRFHIHTEWLNPYPWDIGFEGLFWREGNRGYVIIVDNLPQLRITNESSGDSFVIDLNDFDESLRSNTENESKINSWMEFGRLSNPSGSATHGIDAGSVYRMIEPSPNNQPYGLARTIQEDPNKWTWRSTLPAPGQVRPAGYIYPSDTIHIESINPVKMNLTIVPTMGETIENPENPDSFANRKGHVLKYENIPFDDIDIRISGSSYSRSRSTDYQRNDYRLAFTFKLLDDEKTLQYLANHLTLRTPVFDFRDSSIRALFDIPEVAGAARGADPLTTDDLFYDETDRENTAQTYDDETKFHLYDIPILEPLSPGVFSQLHFYGRPHPWVGSPLANASQLNEVYDRYYFSGSVVSDEWVQDPQPWTANNPQAGLLANHRIRPVLQPDNRFPSETDMLSTSGAAYALVDGGFNIFSASTEAWTAFLKNQFQNNSALSIRNSESGSIIEGVFSRLPFGSPNISDQLADSAITEPEQRNKLLYRQGIRALDRETELQISLLAENIVGEIQAEIGSAGTNAITSMRDLINSGAIDRAIESAGINSGGDTLDPISPGFLRQSDIFSLLGTQMTTRSDTFVIRAYGDSINARSGQTQARAWCEAVVQRYPEYMVPTDRPEITPSETLNIILGRRFKVVSFRWLQPQEI